MNTTAYGEVVITRGGSLQSNDPLGQRWSYTCRFRDEESECIYYRARTYNSRTGRFLQRDPLGYAASPNLSEYASSCPVMNGDPLGLEDDGRPVGPSAGNFTPRVAPTPGGIYLGGMVGGFHQGMGGLRNPDGSAMTNLVVHQDLQSWIWLWKEADTSPSRVEYTHISEYFKLSSGSAASGGDTHNFKIPGSAVDANDGDPYCAFVMIVFSMTETGTIDHPFSQDTAYDVAQRSGPSGGVTGLTNFEMASSGTFEPGNNRVHDVGFHALTQPSYYTYTLSGNWCGQHNGANDLRRCPTSNFKRPRRVVTDAGAAPPTTPSDDDPPAKPPPGAGLGR